MKDVSEYATDAKSTSVYFGIYDGIRAVFGLAVDRVARTSKLLPKSHYA